MIRLDKLLSNLGHTSRAAIKKFISAQQVTVNSLKPASPAMKVDPNTVQINGKALEHPGTLHLILNKPRGYVTSRARDSENKIVFDLLPPIFSKRVPELNPAGRLDKWASGLLVFSQDGKLIQKLASPRRKSGALGKVYQVQLQNALNGDEASVFASGKLLLRSETKECKPAKLEIIDPIERLVEITLYEGRYHQLRRMLAAVGNRAVSIHRVQTGPIKLGDLPIGHWRVLTKEELEAITKM